MAIYRAYETVKTTYTWEVPCYSHGANWVEVEKAVRAAVAKYTELYHVLPSDDAVNYYPGDDAILIQFTAPADMS